MYEIKVIEHFSAAHNLRGYKGKCENLHGHNWKVEARLNGPRLDKDGMLADFSGVKKYLRKVLSGLDHAYLNETPHFKKVNPTSENISKYIFDALSRKFKGVGRVTVWETDSACASYFPE